MTDRLKKWIEEMKKPGEQKGITIVEILVAITILVTTLISVEMSVAAGLTRLKEQQLNRMAGECARIAMEYFSAVPMDKLEDYGNMANFVQGVDSACKDMMANGKIGLKFEPRKMCAAYTEVDPATLLQYTACYYGLTIDTKYNSIMSGTQKTITFEKKFFTGGGTTSCEANCGVGGGPGGNPPDRVYNL